MEKSQLWAYRAMLQLAHQAMTDRNIGAERRIKLTRATLMAAARLYPDAAKEEIAGVIRDHRGRLQDKKAARAAAAVEPAPEGATVIPIRG
jgi:hypothetical protein